MIYISNSFSLQMVSCAVTAQEISLAEAKELCLSSSGTHRGVHDYGEGEACQPRLVATSVVGHADIAHILGEIIGTTVPMNRENVTLHAGDVLIVGQYVGGRLPEGTTTLPEGAEVKWFKVQQSQEDDYLVMWRAAQDQLNKAEQPCLINEGERFNACRSDCSYMNGAGSGYPCYKEGCPLGIKPE
jgi:hypothetical protein